MMNKKGRRPPKFVFIFFAIAAVFVFSAIVMLLWNAILPNVLNVKAITYWQALGILILCKILFGGCKGKPDGQKFERMRNFREKIKNMTPEEKEHFKEEWRRRCGR